ncbi:MAG TPA: class II aldolase/adducin family protein [Dehalococcoidia bacterium]|nr:class II aldolase/adducin family protein [Dehalococcoidia bacterium]
MSMWDSEKKTVLEAAQRMSQRGFVVGTAGNVSMRLNDLDGRQLMVITPTGKHYDSTSVADMVVVDFKGNVIEGQHTPSVETMMHVEVYKTRKKVNAVIHSHPVFSSAIAVAGLEIPPIVDDQITYLGGGIKVADYALSGSQDMVQNVISALGPRNAVLMSNHGALCVGRDMREAFTNLEMLEKTAKIYISVLSIGKLTALPVEAIEVQRAFFEYMHGEGE